MSAFMNDSNGDTYENSEVASITTGSFRYRICRICSISWVLTKSGEKCSELTGVCDKCNKTNSLLKTHVDSENFSNNNSSNSSNKKSEDEENSKLPYVKLYRLLPVNFTLQTIRVKRISDYDDNPFLNINSISGSLNTNEHFTPDLLLRRIDDSSNTRKSCWHQCGVCPKIFQHATALANHEHTHTDRSVEGRICDEKQRGYEKSLSCKHCFKKFKFSSRLFRHVRLVHRSAKLVKCSKCSINFGDVSKHVCFKEYVPGRCKNTRLFEKHLSAHQRERNGLKSLQKNFAPQATPQAHSSQQTLLTLCSSSSQQTDFVPQAVSHMTASSSQTVSPEMIDCKLQSTSLHTTSKSTSLSVSEGTDKYLQTSSQGLLTHACSICLQFFAESKEMMEHEQLHRPDAMEKCGICQETFDTELLLWKHCRTIHRDRSTLSYTCSWSVCVYETKRVKEFVNHARLHSGVKPSACRHCDHRWLIEHIRISHQNKMICTKTISAPPTTLASKVQQTISQQTSLVTQSVSLSQHPIENSAQVTVLKTAVQLPVTSYQVVLNVINVKCSLPEQRKNDSSSTIDPVNENPDDHHPSETILLKQAVSHMTASSSQTVSPEMIDCRLQSTSLHTTSKSTSLSVSEDTDKYLETSSQGLLTHACSICSQFFAESREQLHRPDPGEKCGICQETFDTESLLYGHCFTAHRDDRSQIYTCSWGMCPYAIKNIREFVNHARSHSGVKPSSCRQCEHRWLIEHIRRSHQNKMKCNKTFSTTTTTNRHIMCTFVKHARLHSGVKPYACTQCEHRYTSKSGLMQHIRLLHQNKMNYNKTHSTQPIALASKVQQTRSKQTASVAKAVSPSQHPKENNAQVTVLRTAVQLPVTSHQDVLNVIKVECSLPDQRKSDSSSTMDDDPVNENPEDHHSSETSVKIQNADVSLPKIDTIFHVISPISVIEQQTVTSNQDKIDVIKYDPSLQLKLENKSSKIDEDSSNNNPSDNLFSKTNIEVQYTDVRLKYCTPDLILSRVDNLYEKSCCHQCRICPKIFRYVAALARHERTHTNTLPFVGKILDGELWNGEQRFSFNHCVKEFKFHSQLARHIRQVHDSLPKLVKCSKCFGSFEDISKHICISDSVPCNSNNVQADCTHSNFNNTTLKYIREQSVSKRKAQALRRKLKSLPFSFLKTLVAKAIVQTRPKTSALQRTSAFEGMSQKTIDISQATPAPQMVSLQAVSATQAVFVPGSLPHACPICCQLFVGRIEMMAHHRLHRPDPSENCGICKESFGTKLLLRIHCRSNHRDISTHLFMCSWPSCTFKAKDLGGFFIHGRKHTGEKPFVCTPCGKRYVSKNSLIRHIKSGVHSFLQNKKCTKTLSGQSTTLASRAEILQSACILEAEEFQHASSASKPLADHFFDVYSAVSQQTTVASQQSAHGPLTHACSICSHRFAGQIEMMKHMQLHRPNPSEQCRICPEICNTDFLLQEHYWYKHRDKSSQLFRCNLCQYTSKDAGNFIVHVRVHTGENPYACTQCEYRCISERKLSAHVQLEHKGRGPYRCPQCRKLFYQFEVFQLHWKTHEDEHTCAGNVGGSNTTIDPFSSNGQISDVFQLSIIPNERLSLVCPSADSNYSTAE